MIKDISKRREIVREIIDSPNQAAERLEMFAISLKSSRHSEERIRIAAELFHLSEQTILKDYLPY